MSLTYLAIGAHIGDMDLTAGPVLAAAALAGHRAVLLALTPGERGHPRIGPAAYKEQKTAEGQAFADRIGAEFRLLDYSDGFLPADTEVCLQVAELVREIRPDVVIAHWKNSIHTDHENASIVAERARFYAGLPTNDVPDDDSTSRPRHGVRRFVYAENWEDAEGFHPSTYVPIPDQAYDVWRTAIEGQAFARGETYGFRYIDYYTALMTMRGCLAGANRACAFAVDEASRREVRDIL